MLRLSILLLCVVIEYADKSTDTVLLVHRTGGNVVISARSVPTRLAMLAAKLGPFPAALASSVSASKAVGAASTELAITVGSCVRVFAAVLSESGNEAVVTFN